MTSPPLRIGIDVRQLVWPGIGKYTFELVRHLAQIDSVNDYTLFYRSPAQFEEHPIRAANFRIVYVPFDIYALPEHLWFGWQILSRRIEIFHSPSSLNVPVLHPCKLVVSLHDIMFKEKPELIPSKLAGIYFRLMNGWAIHSAARLLCISNFTRDRVAVHYPRQAAKAIVAHNGVSDDLRPVTDPVAIAAMKTALGIRHPYVLYVGTYKRHKNLLTLVRAFAALPEAVKAAHQLVFVRKQYTDRPEVDALIAELGIADRFVPIDFVPNELMAALYSGAAAGVFPAIYEGFGLPLVEAMACGAPVVASDIPAFRETTAGHFPLVNPQDPLAFRDQLAALLTEPAAAAERRRAGFAAAAPFAWKKTAHRALATYEELAGPGRSLLTNARPAL